MSDSESNAPLPAPHATTGGKSLANVERPRYKSWRKKYRKMRHKFDGVLEENRKLFKEEQKLESIAKRLREELDQLLDLLLDVNSNPALPPELRFNISLDQAHSAIAAIPSVVPADILPETANEMLVEYTVAVQRGQIPHLDLNVIRHQLDKTLAAQGVAPVDHLGHTTSHTIVPANDSDMPEDMRGSNPPSFLTAEEEDAHLLRLDAKLGDPVSEDRMREKEKEGADEKHWAELTPREVERQTELQNPQSQHNWLKTHAKNGAGMEVDDNESLASHDTKPAPARGGKGKRDLAKQVGDRAVGRAREGFSPGAASAGFGEEDDFAFVDEHPGASKKRGRGDVDGTYRVKGGKTGAGKGKRKRSGEDVASTASGSSKKAKVEANE
ncbi:hypothetical protein PRZ48_004588 [Zasmidium cellare]|uniref:IEC3 subunit of the Ino80 complex, chromatin re-modelling-domain-containing protein n=1 Tax=Zasmidium cellare TaxID=395010 RepID=A0ABR0ER48_ZASCE|nr:hypothetical protein PRZ48_004588 [Zasmidium cellare]